MARETPYGDLIRQTVELCKSVFAFRVVESYQKPTKREKARIPNVEWIPDVMTSFYTEWNGLLLEWEATAEQLRAHPHCRGRVDIKRLQDTYGDWKDVVYFDFQPEEQQRRTFKVVDFFADEACVGIYHTEARDPALYYSNLEDAPEPLGVDIWGYFRLLPLSLGYRYWPKLLASLHRHCQAGATTPFRVGSKEEHQLVTDLTALVPGFTLDALVQRYDEVRLRR